MRNWGIKPAVSQPQQLQSTAGCYQEGTGGWDSPLLAPGVQGTVPPGAGQRAPPTAQGQQQGRTQPARCGHPLRGEMNPFLEALMKKHLLTTNST